MKKVAFILALAFVFLVGEKIVVQHKIWAEDKKIVYWIPLNEDGKFVLDKIKPEGEYKKAKTRTYPVQELPVNNWSKLENLINITQIYVKTKNPHICWITCSEGACSETCVEYP